MNLMKVEHAKAPNNALNTVRSTHWPRKSYAFARLLA